MSTWMKVEIVVLFVTMGIMLCQPEISLFIIILFGAMTIAISDILIHLFGR